MRHSASAASHTCLVRTAASARERADGLVQALVGHELDGLGRLCRLEADEVEDLEPHTDRTSQ